jgi:hypothetical protein
VSDARADRPLTPPNHARGTETNALPPGHPAPQVSLLAPVEPMTGALIQFSILEFSLRTRLVGPGPASNRPDAYNSPLGALIPSTTRATPPLPVMTRQVDVLDHSKP